MTDAIGVVGVDGFTPTYNPSGRFQLWSIHEIWKGETGKGKFIPKQWDYVLEPETGVMYVVTDLDNVTFIPELTPANIKQDVSRDYLTTATNDNYRIYYDKSIDPYTLCVDGFMRVYHSTASFARIYRGTDIDPTKIISRRYDNNGNFVSHDIPLVMVSYSTHDNYGVKSIPTSNCDVELVDGEACIVVVFDSSGKVVTKVRCVIEETTYVAQAYAEQKYITQIFLKTVFIDETQTSDIHYPVNLPIPSFNPIGVVQYNDGSQVEYPVDGDKFRLYGLDQFVSTIMGHKVPLVLSYRLDSNEAALANVDTDGFFVTRPYNLIVSNPNRSYNVKMFVYPVWVDALNGYKYKVFLMNLDRNMLYDITNITGLTSSSPSFNPLAYGIMQRLTFMVDLAKVNGAYSSFLHVQTVDIILRGQATDTTLVTPWEVGNQVPSTVPYYGSNLRAVRNNTVNQKVYIGNNIATVEEFINRLYKSTQPLFNPMTETEAPTPTHIEICYLGKTVFTAIGNYDQEVVFDTPVAMNSNVEVVFYKETVTGYLKLSVASLLVR